jgi:hypothetical protein
VRTRFSLAIFLACTSCQLTLRTKVERSPKAAALAIRDDVSDFQKWGTKTFSLQFLEPAYAHVDYFVEARAENPRGERDAFIRALRRALEKHESVDLFLLAHSNHYKSIRLVYNTGCGDADQGGDWMALGAGAYVGHPGSNLAPIFVYYFLPEWSQGTELDQAVARANEATKDEILGGVTMLVLKAAGEDPEVYWRNTEARIFGDDRIRLIE